MYRQDILTMLDTLRAFPGDACLPIGHANYLFKTDGVIWAMDPSHREYEIPSLPGVEFVLLTHEHDDHYQPRTLMKLAAAGSRILAPDFLPGIENIPGVEIVSAGMTLHIGSITIRVLPGRHYDEGTDIGVPEVGYWVESSALSMAFPGDVRDYTEPFSMQHPDWLFAHVWLGRRNALNLPCEPWLGKAGRFFADIQAKHVVLAHLNDATRIPEDRWTDVHADLMKASLPGAVCAGPLRIIPLTA